MNVIQAIRSALYYRILSGVSFLLGLVIAGVGVRIGGEGVIDALLSGGSPLEAATSLPLVVVSVLAGLLVWQVGSTAAFYKTLDGAIGTGGYQTEKLKAEIVSAVDDQLSNAQAQPGSTEGTGAGGAAGDPGPDGFGGAGDPDLADASAGHDTQARAGRERASYDEGAGAGGGQGRSDSGSSQEGINDPNAAFER